MAGGTNNPGIVLSGGSVPAGVIVMWSGAIANIPSDWALCDGTYGTPDLRDRFIVGAGGSLSPAAAGGSSTHSHTYSDVISHTHDVDIADPGHTHTQNAHTHVQDSHNHTQNSHNHTQDAHNHGITDPGHTHTLTSFTTDGAAGRVDTSASTAGNNITTGSSTTGITINNATATNQAATATNNAATATNQNTTATNNANTTGITASTANPAGSVAAGETDSASTLPPYFALAYIMKI